MNVGFNIPPELLEQITAEIADRVASRLPSGTEEPWRLLNLKETAVRLGRSERWVRERAKRGDLPRIHLDNGALAFDIDDVRAFARSRRIPQERPGETREQHRDPRDWWKADQ